MVRSVGGDWDFLRCSLTRCVVVVWRLFLDERLRVGCGSFEVFGGLVVEIGTWEDCGRENESGSFVPFRLEEKGSGSTLLFSESRLLPFGLRSLAKLRVEPQQYHNIGASRGQAPLSLFFPSTTHFFPLHPRSIKLLPSTNSLPVASHPLQKHNSHLPASLIFQSTPVIPKSPGPVLISESTANVIGLRNSLFVRRPLDSTHSGLVLLRPCSSLLTFTHPNCHFRQTAAQYTEMLQL